MYKSFIRPVLFLLGPEKIHHIIVFMLKYLFKIPGVSNIVQGLYTINHPSLEREFAGIKFPNPVGFAAGFDKNAEFTDPFSSFGFGFIEIGTVTPKGQPGNPKPRSFRLPKDKALINRMGFNNQGVDQVVENLKKSKKGTVIGGNIGKNTLTPNDQAIEDYVVCFDKLYPFVDYFVVNISCPNIKDLKELQNRSSTEALLTKLISIRASKSTKKPVLLKISPDLNNAQLDDIIDIYFTLEIDGIVATNTTISRKNLTTNEDRVESIGNGGLSGQPLTKRALDVVRYIREKSNHQIPVIGVGGIMSVSDALSMLDAGATLLQLYTGFIYEGPALVKNINKEIIKRNG